MATTTFPRPSTLLLTGLLTLWTPFLVYPVFELVQRCVTNKQGDFVGLENFTEYFSSPGLVSALVHSLTIGLTGTTITVTLAFFFAYGITHRCIPGRFACGTLFLLPLFAPSLLPAIGLIYLFGAQGILKEMLMGHDLYGPLGIVLGCVLFSLPHAILLLTTSLRNIDGTLYDAAATLGAGPLRRFFTVTLPNARYGLISASFVTFTLTITDFGVPKVLGGDYSMLATEIYSQVIGQQNFTMGAIISVVLLLPTALTLTLDVWARHGQARLKAGRLRRHENSRCYEDYIFGAYCWLLVIGLALSLCVVVWASFMAFWPYDLSWNFDNYAFEEAGYSWTPLLTSLSMALCAALGGVAFLSLGSYLTERTQACNALKTLYSLMMLFPLSLPGLVLGLSYIFAFNSGWLSPLYGSFALLVINTMVHFTTVGHLTCVSALGKLDKNYELVGRSMGIPTWRTVFRVVLPLCRTPLSDVFFYIFVNAMTTVSAVIFLCSAGTTLAAISIINMYDSGQLGSAAAMGTLVFATTALCGALHACVKKYSL